MMKLMLRAVAALALALLTTASVPAQQSGQNPARDPIDRVMRERNRVFNNRVVEDELRRPAEQRKPELTIAQIKEDYVRIQLVNKELAQAVATGGVLDLKFVAQSASEIKKRAERLNHNLVLPEPEDGAKRSQVEAGTEAEQLKSSLSALSQLIVGFVHNPLFRKPGVVDVRDAAKARRDLEEIIKLSEQVKKSSERLNKAAQKSQ
ncbi:MAG TPA: hypothetical protein VF553_01930 [Pyrinomonadaceae bacterium]